MTNKVEIHRLLLLFSQSTKHSEFLIKSEVRSAESLEARSTESQFDVVPKVRRCVQVDVNLGQALFIYIYIYLLILMCAQYW